MKVILLQNTLHNGARHRAGDTIDLADAVADAWIKARLAYANEAEAEAVATPKPKAKARAKRGAKK